MVFRGLILTKILLRPPGGSITVFSTLFNNMNNAVLLSYAFALDPYSSLFGKPPGTSLSKSKEEANYVMDMGRRP